MLASFASLALATGGAVSGTPQAPAGEHRTAALPRSTSDRPDDQPGAQIHIVYVLPSDGADRALDTDGTLAASARNFQAWLAGQTGGSALRLDTSDGELDISFHRMSQTDAQIAANGAYVRDVIERELIAVGFSAPRKIYAVYYDGSSTHACGGGAWPPTLPGSVGALYLRATYGAGYPCYTAADSRLRLQLMDLAMLHEVMHTMGFVPTCAPHHTRAGHVSDSPTDLMYAGDEPWYPSVLDVGRDDYFGAPAPGCLDFADSPYLQRAETALTVAVTAQGGGSGSVSSTPPGIACPGTCKAEFGTGSTVGLAAKPAANSRFVGWGGACSGSGPCQVVLDAPKEVSAVFAVRRHRVTVQVKGRGRVVSAPPGLACPGRCSAEFDSGTRVALRAVPTRGWLFAGWRGACAARGRCVVLLSGNRTAVAAFIRR